MRVDDDDDDGFEILTTHSTTNHARAFERRRTRVRTFDDFTVAFVSNEARDSSLADGRRRDVDDERRRDAAFARAISDETRVGVDAGSERCVRRCTNGWSGRVCDDGGRGRARGTRTRRGAR